ncbi:diaminopimelate epimerase [Erysipelotrichaceae bacterium]|nr:diaminopimelate epimerase [Erysipelotrichaceae bacterium]
MKTMEFYKYHGCGNDFIIISEQQALEFIQAGIFETRIAEICDRHFGVGADGLIFSQKIGEQYKMHYYNSDGSSAYMCGNGMRAFRQYLADVFLDTSPKLTILTSQSAVEVCFKVSGEIDVNLGAKPDIHICEIEGNTYYQTYTMTDHLVRIDQNIPENWAEIGASIEKNSLFPKGTNVNFMSEKQKGIVEMQTWERGAGITLACGTGAVAVAHIYFKFIAPACVEVKLLVAGGILYVRLIGEQLHLIGEASQICKGTFNLK